VEALDLPVLGSIASAGAMLKRGAGGKPTGRLAATGAGA